MLFSATVTVWNSAKGKTKRVKDETNGTLFLLNGRRLQGLEVRDTTHSKFLYFDSLRDYRENPAYIEASETTTAIATDIDKTFQSMVPTIAFYTNNDATLATFNRKINVEEIVYVEKDGTYPATKSWIAYMEGSKMRKLLCAYSIAQVKELCDAGDLTTP